MEQFFRIYWANIWDGKALLGDRVKGIILVLLVFSLVCTAIGGFVHLLQERARRDGADANGNAPPAPGSAADRAQALGQVLLKLFNPFCDGLPISVGASVIFFLLLGLLGLEHRMRWAGAAASLPALLVLLQYVYLWAHKPRQAEKPDDDGPIAMLQSQEKRAKLAIESSYGARTLFIRYGFPAILLLVEGLLLAFVLMTPAFLDLRRWEIAYGAQFGALGAYAWVVIELGRRSFRRDVTAGSALWAIVTLALGPMLAAVIALVWKPNPDETESAWQLAVVYFYAGYAPRTVLSVMTSAAAQLLRIGPAPHVETRTTPLTKIRGINPAIEERLAEEGIDNVETLATAEPIRLFRDTPFDLRNILWWIDEALLMMYVPQRWQLLEEQGITGAIDLADLANQAAQEENAGVEEEEEEEENDGSGTPSGGDSGDSSDDEETEAPLSRAPAAALILRDLARQANLRQTTFRSLADRVLNDQQVAYVWLLYNAYVTDGHHSAQDEKKPENDALA